MDKICEKEISVPFQEKAVRDKNLDPEFAATIHLETDLTQIRKKLQDGVITRTEQWGQEMRSFWTYVCKSLPRGPLQAMAADLSAYFEKKYKDHPRCKNEEWLNEFKRAESKVEDLVYSYPNRRSHETADTDYAEPVTTSTKIEEEHPKPASKVIFSEDRKSEPAEIYQPSSSCNQAPIIARDPRLNKPVVKSTKINLFEF